MISIFVRYISHFGYNNWIQKFVYKNLLTKICLPPLSPVFADTEQGFYFVLLKEN